MIATLNILTADATVAIAKVFSVLTVLATRHAPINGTNISWTHAGHRASANDLRVVEFLRATGLAARPARPGAINPDPSV
jgi:hypothetical protein